MIVNKDCLEFIKSIESESVDLVLTDPPYFEIVKNDWDNQWKSEDEYIEWCREWTKECVRVLKPNRCFYIWGTTKTDTFLKYKINVLNSFEELYYKNWIIWSYDWGGRPRNNFARKHEDLLMYSKGKDFLFNADDVCVERAVKTNMGLERKKNLLKKKIKGEEFTDKDKKSWETYRLKKVIHKDITRPILKKRVDCKQQMSSFAKSFSSMKSLIKEVRTSALSSFLEELEEKAIKFAKGKIPTDVWNKNNHTTSKEYCNWHPTQKPLELLERVIKANTNKGDVVLDIFSGSGSTAIAANNTGRIFWGCEKDTEYYEKSLIRIEELSK